MKEQKTKKISVKLPNEETIETAFNEGIHSVKNIFFQLTDLIQELAKNIEKQNKIINELDERISKNSNNSSKPPSSDGYRKVKRTKSLRKKSNKTNGGQPGHKGHTLKQIEKPEKVEIHNVFQCNICQTSLENVDVQKIEKRQVFDLPPIHIEVTEHQAEIKICPNCGSENKGEFPEKVKSPAQYGTKVKTLSSYFTNYHFIPLKRTGEIFRDVFGHPISEATIIKANHEQKENVKNSIESIKTNLQKSDVLNADESGIRKESDLHWIHCISNEYVTLYEIHKNRGTIAMDEMKILPDFEGTIVHDHWKSYFKYTKASHALCNAHHLRELNFIIEKYKQVWARNMFNLLIQIKKRVEESKHKEEYLPPKTIQYFEEKYDEIVNNGYFVNPLPDDKKNTTPLRLLNRLKKFKKETLAFMYDFNIPFDNNLGERDIRMIKVKQKISGSFRSDSGADTFCSIRSFISTLIKNGKNIMQELYNANNDNSFMLSDLNL